MTSCIRRREEAVEAFRTAYSVLEERGEARVRDMMSYLAISDKAVYARLKKLSGEFKLEKGKISLLSGEGRKEEEKFFNLRVYIKGLNRRKPVVTLPKERASECQPFPFEESNGNSCGAEQRR